MKSDKNKKNTLSLFFFRFLFFVVQFSTCPFIFSSPEPKARVSYCNSAPSVCRPSGVNFHIFDFSSETVERNSTKLVRKQDLKTLYQVCVFWADRKKQHGRPGLWLAETFLTSPLKPLNGIQRNLTGSKISKFSTSFVFFRSIRKTRWPPRALIGWDIFHFSSETPERNSMKLDRKQDLNILYHVCGLRADQKNKIATLASYLLRHFRLLWNRWPEFNEIWQKASSQRPHPVCVFRAYGKNNMASLASDWLRHILTFPLKPLYGIQRNLTWSKISTSSTKFVFFRPKSK